ncbi:MAG: sulfite exporter TauE/SafE family protein [Solirubrobacteraceae bacterium]
MTLGQALLTAGAGLLAGAVNAAAGGGTLIAFPALVAAGVGSLEANIACSVGLLSGYAGGSLAYRRELAGQGRRVRSLAPAAVLGGVAGALILLATPEHSFRQLAPFLILAACALLAAQPRLAARLAGRPAAEREIGPAVLGGVFLAAVYGSYFGAGLGVLLLGVLGILLREGLQRLNALKGLLSLVINAAGVAVFLVSGRVAWAFAAVLAVSAAAGGTLGVSLARRLSAGMLRAGVVSLGLVVAAVLLFQG